VSGEHGPCLVNRSLWSHPRGVTSRPMARPSRWPWGMDVTRLAPEAPEPVTVVQVQAGRDRRAKHRIGRRSAETRRLHVDHRDSSARGRASWRTCAGTLGDMWPTRRGSHPGSATVSFLRSSPPATVQPRPTDQPAGDVRSRRPCQQGRLQQRLADCDEGTEERSAGHRR
jgi:hypothetical protein